MLVMKFDVNETYAPNPRTTAKGRHIVHISIDKEGNEKPPLLLADKFDIVGNGTDGGGAHYRIIRYQDRTPPCHARKSAATPHGRNCRAWG